MKKRNSIVLITALAIASQTLVLQVTAAPDSVFNPVLQDIRNQLPSGMVMRLPSGSKFFDYQGQKKVVYPTAVSQNGANGLNVFLSSTPNCGSRSCGYGYLKVSKSLDEFENSLFTKPISNQMHPSQPGRICGIVSKKEVSLNKSINAMSFNLDTCGASSGKYELVIWKQDGYFFVVSVGASNLNVARSMANEPPIRSNR